MQGVITPRRKDASEQQRVREDGLRSFLCSFFISYLKAHFPLASPSAHKYSAGCALWMARSLSKPACLCRRQNKLRPLEFASLTPSNVIPWDLQICQHHAEKLPPLRTELANFSVLLCHVPHIWGWWITNGACKKFINKTILAAETQIWRLLPTQKIVHNFTIYHIFVTETCWENRHFLFLNDFS